MRLSIMAAVFLAGAASATAGLVSRYTFDETAGTVATDSGPAAANGLIGTNVTTGAPGKFGTAFTFHNDASQNGIVDMGNSAAFAAINASQRVTVSVWLKWTSSSDNRDSAVFLGNNTVSDRYLDVGTAGGTNTANRGGVFARCRGATSYPGLMEKAGLNNGVWHHIAYTANAATNVSRLYVDGVPAGTTTTALSFPAFNNLEVGRLGRSAPADAFAGSVDELQIHDTILSAAEIAALAGLPPADPLLATATTHSYENDGSPQRYVVTFRNEGASQTLQLNGSTPVTLGGADAGSFSIAGHDTPLAPGVAGEILLDFNPIPPATTVRDYRATLSIASNDPMNPVVPVDLHVRVTPIIADRDGDGLADSWEISHGLDPDDDGSLDEDQGRYGDPDGDGTTNIEEQRLGTGPDDAASPDARPWQARPGKAHLMIISAHPDDEGIFFGGTYAYYTQVRRLQVVGLSMTSGDATLAPEVRESEFRNAVWTYGLRNPPVFARFRDRRTSTLNETWDLWADGAVDGKGIVEGRQIAARTIAGWIRRYRPDVLVTHDFDGEYGHMNHEATALATLDAFAIAADPQVEIHGLPPWQARKLYSHLYPSGRLFHDHWEETTIDTDADGTPDASPRQVTNKGMEYHVTQGKPKVSTVHAAGEVHSEWAAHPSEWWGLVASTLGPDPVLPDFIAPNQHNQPMTYSGWARGDFLANLTAFPDSDSDGLPDDWELEHFPELADCAPDEDEDHDGVTNKDEFIMGLDPLSPDRLHLEIDRAGWTVGFSVPATGGPGYEGLSRSYHLLGSGDLRQWEILSEGVADGLPRTHPLPSTSAPRFYRLAVEIK